MPVISKKKASFEIKYSKYLVGTPVVPLLPQAWLEMVNDNIINNWSIPVHDAFEVIYEVEQDGFVRGFIAFSEFPGELYIRMSYTVPSARRSGVNTRLFNRLKEIAKSREGLTRISGGTFMTNKPMLDTYKAQGREQIAIISQYQL